MRNSKAKSGLIRGFGRKNYAARLKILATSDDGLLQKEAIKVLRCGKPFRCFSPHCYNCASFHKNYLKGSREENGARHIPPVHRPGQKYRNYLERSEVVGQMFNELEQTKVSAVTINLGIHPINEDCKPVLSKYRESQRNFFKSHLSGVHVIGDFEFADMYAKNVPTYAIDTESWRKEEHSDGIVTLIHMHLSIYHPSLSRDDLESVLRKRFPGQKQIMVSEYSHEMVDGRDLKGGIGWILYGRKRHFRFDFDEQNEEVFKAAARRNIIMDRRRTKFEFGMRVLENEWLSYLRENEVSESEFYEDLETLDDTDFEEDYETLMSEIEYINYGLSSIEYRDENDDVMSDDET